MAHSGYFNDKSCNGTNQVKKPTDQPPSIDTSQSFFIQNESSSPIPTRLFESSSHVPDLGSFQPVIFIFLNKIQLLFCNIQCENKS